MECLLKQLFTGKAVDPWSCLYVPYFTEKLNLDGNAKQQKPIPALGENEINKWKLNSSGPKICGEAEIPTATAWAGDWVKAGDPLNFSLANGLAECNPVVTNLYPH